MLKNEGSPWEGGMVTTGCGSETIPGGTRGAARPSAGQVDIPSPRRGPLRAPALGGITGAERILDIPSDWFDRSRLALTTDKRPTLDPAEMVGHSDDQFVAWSWNAGRRTGYASTSGSDRPEAAAGRASRPGRMRQSPGPVVRSLGGGGGPRRRLRSIASVVEISVAAIAMKTTPASHPPRTSLG